MRPLQAREPARLSLTATCGRCGQECGTRARTAVMLRKDGSPIRATVVIELCLSCAEDNDASVREVIDALLGGPPTMAARRRERRGLQ